MKCSPSVVQTVEANAPAWKSDIRPAVVIVEADGVALARPTDLQREILKRRLQLRLGHQVVAGGVTGSIQLDGGNALVRLPYGLGVSAYVGSPVSQRLDERGTEATFNPQPGNFATGGRAYWTMPAWGEAILSTALAGLPAAAACYLVWHSSRGGG